jgi:hypothetical protein
VQEASSNVKVKVPLSGGSVVSHSVKKINMREIKTGKIL